MFSKFTSSILRFDQDILKVRNSGNNFSARWPAWDEVKQTTGCIIVIIKTCEIYTTSVWIKFEYRLIRLRRIWEYERARCRNSTWGLRARPVSLVQRSHISVTRSRLALEVAVNHRLGSWSLGLSSNVHHAICVNPCINRFTTLYARSTVSWLHVIQLHRPMHVAELIHARLYDLHSNASAPSPHLRSPRFSCCLPTQ